MWLVSHLTARATPTFISIFIESCLDHFVPYENVIVGKTTAMIRSTFLTSYVAAPHTSGISIKIMKIIPIKGWQMT